MWNYKLKKVYIMLTLIFWFWIVFAHNTRLVWDTSSTQENSILVSQPENSQAFYAQLKWNSDFYKIVSNTGFLLYLSLTVPAISWSDLDYWMMVKDNSWNILINIDSTNLKWTKFYEKFAWDLYYQWPWFERQVNSWIYYVQIYSTDNIWKYALAIWKLESRPINEITNTFKDMPALKSYFFEKPVITMFYNYIWLSLFFIIVFVVLFILLINKLIKKFKS
jgi:hypothetical protein